MPNHALEINFNLKLKMSNILQMIFIQRPGSGRNNFIPCSDNSSFCFEN